MDGREVLREIRADATLRDLPVLILTTSSAAEDEQRMLALGADGYLVKPVSFGALVTMVTSIQQRWLQPKADTP
jgi:DNA-binding response OmpR family regulator